MHKNPFGYMRASELTTVINDTIFAKEIDREIAIDIYVKAMTVERCAEMIGYDSKTVQKRLPLIEDKISHNVEKYRF